MSNSESSKQERRTWGFTLIEVIVTVAILGILLGLGFMSYRQASVGARLDQATQVIAREIDRVRTDARTENRVTYLTITPDATNVDVDGRIVSLPVGTNLASTGGERNFIFVPPYGAAFESADATYDGGLDSRFELEVIEIQWTASPTRASELHVVGALGKAVLQ